MKKKLRVNGTSDSKKLNNSIKFTKVLKKNNNMCKNFLRAKLSPRQK